MSEVRLCAWCLYLQEYSHPALLRGDCSDGKHGNLGLYYRQPIPRSAIWQGPPRVQLQNLQFIINRESGR
jgi:hypothetical protein